MITITINTTRGGTVSAPFAALATERITFQGDIIPGDNTTLAILDEHGGTLAQGHIVGAEADLDLNTCQADEATLYADPGEPIRAYLAVGDTDNLLAVIPCQLVRNALDNIAPPAQMAPTYPTSESLLAILAQMTAQADRAEEAVEATETAQKAVAEYVDEVFPAKVTEAEKSLANATAKGVQAVTDKATQSVNSITSHTTTIIGALDTKVTEANSAIDGKVTEANQAKTDAETAKGQAEASAKRAEVALNNGCVYEVQTYPDGDNKFDIRKTNTIYRQTLSEASYNFTFDLSQIDLSGGKVVVFWLLLNVGETAPQVAFPASVTWLSEPTFAPNTHTLLAFMTVDSGASYVANVQWEKPL